MTQEYYDSNYENPNYGYSENTSGYDRAAERKRKYRRRRIIRRRIMASILALLIVVAILFIVSIFIRVKEITITGTFGSYTYDEVLMASGLREGDRLLYIDTESVENQIEKTLPYMVNVTVERELFSKVKIKIDYSSEVYCLYTNGKYAVVNSDFKVLRFEKNFEQSPLLKVRGLESNNADLGEVLNFTDESKLDYFKKIRDGFQGEPFGEIEYVDVMESTKLSVGFKNGFEIKLGSYINLDYNLNWASAVVNELLQKHDEVDGTLDLSVFKKAFYTPDSGEEEPVVSVG